MKIIITRHGRTVENERRVTQGQAHGTLSATGKRQAKQLADRLKNEQITIIYTSDLKRAADTAKIVAKEHKSAQYKETPLLREKNHGIYSGTSKGTIDKDKHIKKYFTELDAAPKDGESWNDVFTRLKPFVSELKNRAKGKNPKNQAQEKSESIFIVGHGSVNNALLTLLLKKPKKEVATLWRQYNAALTILTMDEEGNCTVLLDNSTEHLKEASDSPQHL